MLVQLNFNTKILKYFTICTYYWTYSFFCETCFTTHSRFVPTRVRFLHSWAAPVSNVIVALSASFGARRTVVLLQICSSKSMSVRLYETCSSRANICSNSYTLLNSRTYECFTFTPGSKFKFRSKKLKKCSKWTHPPVVILTFRTYFSMRTLTENSRHLVSISASRHLQKSSEKGIHSTSREHINSRLIFFFGSESTQLARQLHQERTQMEVQY